MCCRTTVEPLDLVIARTILLIGQFLPQGDPESCGYWKRDVPEENTVVTVSLSGGVFEASIQPSISTYTHHHGKRITGGLYFEICAKYAEKVDGKMIQKANITGCTAPGSHVTDHVMAEYPHMPMMWERACAGFQAVILGEGDEALQ